MKRTLAIILTLILAFSALSVFASAEEDTPTAKVIYGTPYIDGEIDAVWNDAQINRVTTVFANDELTEPSTCQFRAMYDDSYLYLLIEVTDPTMPATGIEWELNNTIWYGKDGVGLAFTPDYNRDVTTTQVAPSFWYILRAFGSIANYNGVDAPVFISEKEGADKADANSFDKLSLADRMYAITYGKDASGNYTGYTMEIKINLKARYEDFKYEAGTKVGFDLYLNDNNYILMSATRNYGLVWSDITSYKDNSRKGTLEFCKKGETFVNTEPEVTTATPTTEEQTTAAPVVTTAEVTTAAPVVTTAEATTAEVVTAEVTTAAPEETTEAAKSGCGSVAACGLAVIAILGSAVVFKKH